MKHRWIDIGPAGIALAAWRICRRSEIDRIDPKRRRYLLLSAADDRMPIERVRVLLEALAGLCR